MITEAKKKLEEIYVNLWGLYYPTSLTKKTYTAILLDATIQKSWVTYLQSKNEFVDTFQTSLPRVENQSCKSIKALYIDRREEFIFAKLKNFCKKKDIKIKYVALYIYKENCIAKRE